MASANARLSAKLLKKLPLATPVILTGSAAAGSYFAQPVAADGTRIEDCIGPGHWLISRSDLKGPGLHPFSEDLGDWLDRHGADAVLVRPDRYVFGTGPREMLLSSWQALADSRD